VGLLVALGGQQWPSFFAAGKKNGGPLNREACPQTESAARYRSAGGGVELGPLFSRFLGGSLFWPLPLFWPERGLPTLWATSEILLTTRP